MSPYKATRGLNNLIAAWDHVRAKGRTSKRKQTRIEIEEFEIKAMTKLKGICSQLVHGTFQFGPSEGIRKKKKTAGDFRPIVMGPVPNRIVKRAILQTLQEIPEILSLLKTPTSFGGVEDGGVRKAVMAAQRAIANGTTHFITSDVANFFSDVRREQPISKITAMTGDDDFNTLLRAAVRTELSNMAELRADAEEFPIYDIGVAQGCCLSPLIANIALEEFDKKLNTADVVCLRYIDDFIILGPSAAAVKSKFREALRILQAMGLTAYVPNDDSGKAHFGLTSQRFTYLGCEFDGGLIRPGKQSWEKLKNDLSKLFDESVASMSDARRAVFGRKTFSDTLNQASLIVRSWGNQYGFCNDTKFFKDADIHLDKLFLRYEGAYVKLRSQKSEKDRRRIAGFFSLMDRKEAPSKNEPSEAVSEIENGSPAANSIT
jgi:retron-type reverse transcriptase